MCFVLFCFVFCFLLGKLWNETSASLLDLALNVIKIFPSEKELLRSTSDLFSSFSFVSSDLSYVIADLSFFEQLSLVLLGNENASGVSRLNSDSICFIVRGFLSLIVSLNKTSIFHNVSVYLLLVLIFSFFRSCCYLSSILFHSCIVLLVSCFEFSASS